MNATEFLPVMDVVFTADEIEYEVFNVPTTGEYSDDAFNAAGLGERPEGLDESGDAEDAWISTNTLLALCNYVIRISEGKFLPEDDSSKVRIEFDPNLALELSDEDRERLQRVLAEEH